MLRYKHYGILRFFKRKDIGESLLSQTALNRVIEGAKRGKRPL